jgi:2-polyprenyl-6-methoxyphenol hydroxylase-like FAD-dependent oxidoreductase
MGSSSSHEAAAPDTSVAPVVVVGGGYGGVLCAVALKKAGVHYRIVGERDYFHHNVAALRAAVDPGNWRASVNKFAAFEAREYRP